MLIPRCCLVLLRVDGGTTDLQEFSGSESGQKTGKQHVINRKWKTRTSYILGIIAAAIRLLYTSIFFLSGLRWHLSDSPESSHLNDVSFYYLPASIFPWSLYLRRAILFSFYCSCAIYDHVVVEHPYYVGRTHTIDCQIEDKNPSKRWNGEFWGFRICIGFGLAVPPLPLIGVFRVCLYNGFLCCGFSCARLISVSFPACLLYTSPSPRD